MLECVIGSQEDVEDAVFNEQQVVSPPRVEDQARPSEATQESTSTSAATPETI